MQVSPLEHLLLLHHFLGTPPSLLIVYLNAPVFLPKHHWLLILTYQRYRSVDLNVQVLGHHQKVDACDPSSALELSLLPPLRHLMEYLVRSYLKKCLSICIYVEKVTEARLLYRRPRNRSKLRLKEPFFSRLESAPFYCWLQSVSFANNKIWIGSSDWIIGSDHRIGSRKKKHKKKNVRK